MAYISKQSLAYEEYVNSDISIEELAKKYNVTKKTMYHMIYRQRKKLGKAVPKRH